MMAFMEPLAWKGIWDYGIAAAYLFFQIVGIILAARVILSNRSTHGTIAWSVSLLLLPVAAVPLYAVFGRDRLRSYISARRQVDDQFARLHPEKITGADPESSFNWTVLAALAKGPPTRDNSVRLFFDGRSTYDSMLEGINRAREYILFQFFIFRDDAEGQRFLERLMEKARSGVRVYFLVDAIGSRDLKPALFQQLQAVGIQTGIFSPGRSLKGRLRLNFRNHRKVVIVDGREGWLGGHNIGVEYVGQSPRFGPWRDTHCHIRGSVVDGMQLAFLEDWYWATRSMPELNWNVPVEDPGSVDAICLPTGPSDADDTCALAFVHLINRANHRIWIHSPYFVPSDEVIVALQLATLRGVEVRVLMPSKMDHRLVWFSSFYFSALPQLNKVRFFRYNHGFLHSKMLLVDDEIVALGTVNFDNRSFRINFESTMILRDPELIGQCDRQMRLDWERSTEDPVDPLAKRSIAFKLAARGARLLSPIL
jgi:cardiolipin synthase